MAGPHPKPFYLDVGFIIVCVLSFGAALGVFVRDGWPLFRAILIEDAVLWLTILPKVIAGVTVAAFLRILLPREVVARWIGARSGLRGLIVATLAGAIIPGGPMTIFPIATALYLSGADRGATVAFITGWLTLGINRAIVWELSFFGTDFVLLRMAISLPFPILCGLAARLLPGRTDEEREADKAKPKPVVPDSEGPA